MEQRRSDNSFFDPTTMIMSLSDEATWKEQVSAGIIYLISVVDELREENADLRRQIGVQPQKSQSDSDEKLTFNAIHVKPHPIKGFDPLQPNRVKAIGTIVADFANGHGLNGCSLDQVVQPITTGVIRKLFDFNADQYTYTEDSIGKGRPARYAKVPTEFIKELSEAISDGFNPSRVQRAQILPQVWTKAGTVARNYFNNARSHRKKATSIGSQQADSLSATSPTVQSTSPMDTACLAAQAFTTSSNVPLFEGHTAFKPVFLPFHPQATYLQHLNSLNEQNSQLELHTNPESANSGFVPVNTGQKMAE